MRKNTNYEDMNKNENRILSAIKNRLVKDYGYPVSLIAEEYPLIKGSTHADLVVFESAKKDKILIVIEVKSGEFVIPLGSAQLQKNMKLADSRYGILTNSQEYLFFEHIDNEFVQIADIPTKKKSQITESKPIPNPSNFIWQLFDQSRNYQFDFNEFDYELLKILTSKFVDEHDSHKTNHMKNFYSNNDRQNYLLLQDMWTFTKDKYPILVDEEIRIDPKFATIIIHMLKDFSISESNLSEIISAILSKTPNLKMGVVDPHQEIINLMLELASIHENDSILIPFCGQGNIFFSLQEYFIQRKTKKEKSNIIFIEQNTKLANQSNMLMILFGLEPSVKLQDPLFFETEETFDKILLFKPPFGRKIEQKSPIVSRDYIDNLIFRLSDKVKVKGKIISLLPQGFLFDHSKQKLRQHLLNEFYLDAIIKPPQGVFYPSFNVNTAIVVLEKKSSKPEIKNSVYTFVGELEGKYSKNVSTNQAQFKKLLSEYNLFKQKNIIKNPSKSGFLITIENLQERWDIHFSLELKEKILTFKNPVKLSDVAEIISGKSILHKSITNGIEVPYLRISDLKDKLILDDVSKNISLSESLLKKLEQTRILPDDIIISRQATIGKTAIVTSKHKGALLSPQIIALRVNEKILPEYLLHVLSLDSTKEQLTQMIHGDFIKTISTKSLKNLIIPLPDLSEQHKIIKKFSESIDKIQALEERLDLLKSNLSKTNVGELK